MRRPPLGAPVEVLDKFSGVHGDERAALMHKLINSLWTGCVEHAEASGNVRLAHDLNVHRRNHMPSLDLVLYTRRTGHGY